MKSGRADTKNETESKAKLIPSAKFPGEYSAQNSCAIEKWKVNRVFLGKDNVLLTLPFFLVYIQFFITIEKIKLIYISLFLLLLGKLYLLKIWFTYKLDI